jgi:cobalt-zinc-cadmium efflux system protein
VTGSHSHHGLTIERAGYARRLAWVLLLNTAYLVAEVVGAAITGSLALLADAGHMLTDAGGVALALLAIRFAARPPTPERTYGYYRAEILAALVNAVLLLGISGYVLYEAYLRFMTPPPVNSAGVIVVAGIGLVVNVVGAFILRGGAAESINVKGAYLEVLADLVSSLAVLAAALIMQLTGWLYADPLASLFIGLFIVPRTWRLLNEAVGVLLEGAPKSIDLGALRDTLRAIPGILDVHDLHVWTLTSGLHAMSAHAVVGDDASYPIVLSDAQQAIIETFAIQHVTLQLEPPGHEEGETHL